MIPCKYRYKWYIAKTRFFGLHFPRRMCRCIFNHFYVMGPKSYWIRRNNANYTAITPFKVTDFVLIPIESPYTTSYYWFILTNLLSCTVSKLWPIIGRIFAVTWKCLTLMPSLGVIPCEYPDNLYLSETRRIVLPDAEKRTIVSSFVWTTPKRDGQTDR